jgi:hypothetical protein
MRDCPREIADDGFGFGGYCGKILSSTGARARWIALGLESQEIDFSWPT